MELIGDFASLGIALCALLAITLAFTIFLSFPGWLAGRIAAPNAPRLTQVRKASTYWTIWVTLGGIPLMVSITGGPFAGVHHFLPTVVAVLLAALALIIANVCAFMLGYKQGLAAKAKKEVGKSLRENLGATSQTEDNVDWLDPKHPAIASTSEDATKATAPLPVVETSRLYDGDAPTQEIAAHDTVSLDDEYPTARPHGY